MKRVIAEASREVFASELAKRILAHTRTHPRCARRALSKATVGTGRRLAACLLSMAMAACAAENRSTSDSSATATGGDSAAVAASCVTHRISGDGVGPLRIGMTVDSVAKVCPIARDTVVLATEGMMSRVLSVPIGRDTVFAEVADGRVWRILVRSQGLFTSDSLSVGSSIATLVELPTLNPMVGEGYLYVASPAHCGMSFRLSVPPATVKDWTLEALRALDPNVHVTRILLLGCQQSR